MYTHIHIHTYIYIYALHIQYLRKSMKSMYRNGHEFHTLLVGAFWASKSVLSIRINLLNTHIIPWYEICLISWSCLTDRFCYFLREVEDAISASLLVICLSLYVFIYTFDTCSRARTSAYTCIYTYLHTYILIVDVIIVYVILMCMNILVFWDPCSQRFLLPITFATGENPTPSPCRELFQVKLQMSGYDFKLAPW